MESLYVWMTEQGYDPSIVPWIIGGIVFLVMLFIWRLIKNDNSEAAKSCRLKPRSRSLHRSAEKQQLNSQLSPIQLKQLNLL